MRSPLNCLQAYTCTFFSGAGIMDVGCHNTAVDLRIELWIPQLTICSFDNPLIDSCSELGQSLTELDSQYAHLLSVYRQIATTELMKQCDLIFQLKNAHSSADNIFIFTQTHQVLCPESFYSVVFPFSLLTSPIQVLPFQLGGLQDTVELSYQQICLSQKLGFD